MCGFVAMIVTSRNESKQTFARENVVNAASHVTFFQYDSPTAVAENETETTKVIDQFRAEQSSSSSSS